MQSLAKRIAAMRATTLAGMRVRALVIADMLDEKLDEDDATTDELIINAIIRYLLSIEALENQTWGRRLRPPASVAHHQAARWPGQAPWRRSVSSRCSRSIRPR
jgi:hypothetical protein